MSDKVTSFVKRNGRRLFELWFYGEIVSQDIKVEWQRHDECGSGDEEDDETYTEILDDLSESYGIGIEIEQLHDHARHAPLESHLRLGAAAILRSELTIYSPTVIKKSRLCKVVLCGGLRGVDPRCIALCSPHAGEMVIEFSCSKTDWRERRLAVHHEIFHHVDYFDDVLQFMDPWWETLNEKGFAYSQQHFGSLSSAPTGFASPYAMCAVHEDKAEVFSHMIVEYERLVQRSQSDQGLRRKIQRMKDLMRQFSPDFDEGFWEKRGNAKPWSISKRGAGKPNG